jgi:hypothetical protein
MATRLTPAIITLVLSSASLALADDGSLTVRSLGHHRWVIERDGEDIGTARELPTGDVLLEDMNGKDIGRVKHGDDGDIDLEESCGDDRTSIACLLDDGDDD